VFEDGTALDDSRVIVEFLDNVSPIGRLIPSDSRERVQVRRLHQKLMERAAFSETVRSFLSNHAAAEADLAVVEHHRLPGRHRPLRGGEVDPDLAFQQALDGAGCIRLAIAGLRR
jgi:glutathione S-transferase